MFSNQIPETALSTNIAISCFSNIIGETHNGDSTFISTLRALVAPRIKDDDSLCLKFKSSSYNKSQISSVDKSSAIKAVARLDISCNEMIIHEFLSSYKSDNEACFELIESSFSEIYSGWYRLDKVTEFFRKTFRVVCFISPERKSVILFTEELSFKNMHYLQCSIFALLPWYFDPEVGVSEEEMELIKSLREKSSEKYEKCIAAIAEKYDLRSANIRNLLSDFESKYELLEYRKAEDAMLRKDQTIQSLYGELSALFREKRECEIRKMGIEQKIHSHKNNESSEIMEYFLANKKLEIVSVSNTKLVFRVKEYLSYYDEELAKTIIDNFSSYIYKPNGVYCDNIIPKNDMKKLMYEIFVEQRLRIRFCAAYEIDVGAMTVIAISGHYYGGGYNDCMPNSHIDRYHCLGDYGREIIDALRNSDYVLAIEQCVASCKSFNFADSIVGKTFVSTLYDINGGEHINNRCIELPDGQVVTPIEAAKWINSQEESKDE